MVAHEKMGLYYADEDKNRFNWPCVYTDRYEEGRSI